ncbi:MAG: leucyl/phenylalanyl-tRNA--protein transferase [Tatlockia sp.]|nr:leucyl/phenylalanyl-tRNA--protein transferase [Tatlockia sp.]
MVWEKAIKLPAFLSANDFSFPDPESFGKEGLVAIGGDLLPQRILSAYQQGIFPWFGSGDPILWWSPDPRLLLKPACFKTSHSLKQSLKKPYSFKIDTAFDEVIRACANTDERINNTWINEEMCEAYIKLHLQGYAHSFEIWNEDILVGGLYGLSLGNAFFGESMFHHLRDGSKLAMFHLCQTLSSLHFDFIDCQLPSPHLQSLGAKKISRNKFLHLLQKSLEQPTRRGLWTNLSY